MQNNNEQTTSNRNVLTDKEFSYMKDYMSWELLAMKKCSEAEQNCTSPDIKQVIKQAGLKHQQHYEAILAMTQ